MYTISQVSTMTGFTADTLRYYEKIGLLPSPDRSTGGARRYDDKIVQRLEAIQCYKRFGLSLQEIKEFIQDGQCFRERLPLSNNEDLQIAIQRQQILSEHLSQLKNKREYLEGIIRETENNLQFYRSVLPQHVLER